LISSFHKAAPKQSSIAEDEESKAPNDSGEFYSSINLLLIVLQC